MATLRGQVDASGNPVLGEGFTSRKTDGKTGTYTVTFRETFKESPIIVATAKATSSGQDRNVTIFASDRSEFSLVIRKASNGDRKDTAFNFYASDDYISR